MPTTIRNIATLNSATEAVSCITQAYAETDLFDALGAIEIEKIMVPEKVSIGDIVTVIITVTVPDTDTLTSLVVTDPLPSQLTYVEGSMRINGTASSQTPNSITLPNSSNTNHEIQFNCTVTG